MARVYATRTDLVTAAPAGVVVPADPEAARLLTSASRRVDRALLCAVYTTDTAGMPTAAAVVEALRDATCAQAVSFLDSGDELGQAGRYQSVSIGSVALTRAAGAGGGGELCVQADEILRVAGLLPGTITAARWSW